jgi:hypothetical protein
VSFESVDSLTQLTDARSGLAQLFRSNRLRTPARSRLAAIPRIIQAMTGPAPTGVELKAPGPTETDAGSRQPPRRRIRALLAVAAGGLSGFRAFLWAVGEQKPRDFDQVWYAWHALVAGRNPYAEIGPGLPFDWSAYFYYPLTAVVAASPLAILSRPWAACAFAALCAGAFVYAATRRTLAPAVVITSGSAAMAAEAVQWSPLLGAAFGVPWLGIFLSAKPTVGLAVFVARPTWFAVLGTAALAGIAFALMPTWPQEWLGAVRHTSLLTAGGTPYVAPITTPGGAFSLLALLRWRRPEARLLLALACVPQTTLLYETVPLFLVPTTIVEGGALWLGSWLVAAWVSVAGPFASDPLRFAASGAAIGWLMYLPCVAMVLRRPNAGPLPSRVDRWIEQTGLPGWLKGRSVDD